MAGGWVFISFMEKGKAPPLGTLHPPDPRPASQPSTPVTSFLFADSLEDPFSHCDQIWGSRSWPKHALDLFITQLVS